MTAVPHDLDPTRHDHALEAAMTDRIRTAEETAAFQEVTRAVLRHCQHGPRA